MMKKLNFKEYYKEEELKEINLNKIKAGLLAASLTCPLGGCVEKQPIQDTFISDKIPEELIKMGIKGTELDALKRKHNRYPTPEELIDYRKKIKQYIKSMHDKYPIEWK